MAQFNITYAYSIGPRQCTAAATGVDAAQLLQGHGWESGRTNAWPARRRRRFSSFRFYLIPPLKTWSGTCRGERGVEAHGQ